MVVETLQAQPAAELFPSGISRYVVGGLLVGLGTVVSYLGTVTIRWALAGMFIGAYLFGYLRTRSETRETAATGAD